jgi:hypothetical protein
MSDTINGRLLQLCHLASQEQDSQKMLRLAAQIDDLLTEELRRKKEQAKRAQMPDEQDKYTA